MFQTMEAARRRGEPTWSRGHLMGCNCVFTRISVRSDGAYVPCVLLPQLVAGQIGQDRLEEVWRESPVLQAVRARADLSLASFPECRGCPYTACCTGSCAGPSLSILGDVNRPNPEACLRRFLQELAAEGLSLRDEALPLDSYLL